MAFLDPEAIHAACAEWEWRVDGVVDSTGSTNADLAALAREGAPGGVVRVAGHQAQGRGRLARSWTAPPNTSLACSVLVEPGHPADDWGWLPLIVGIAVAEGLRQATGLDARLKWPNDVLVDDRKVCGILCEAVTAGEDPRVVLGFGINVALTADDLPVPNATSTMLAGSDASATTIVIAVLGRLQALLTTWDSGRELRETYVRLCTTLGQHVQVHSGTSPFHGQAVGIDPRGGLIVEAAGTRRTFVAGDVVHLR